ncbi:MAG: M56 family metallopeptidase [Pseudanabaenaceae cyanobacterium bins.39]|nr:M56 family metallopeptidase [Pseudanabaenaceae cyanobacterium bins.39]
MDVLPIHFISIHSLMLVSSLGLAWLLRSRWQCQPQLSWYRRWQWALMSFVLSPLLVIVTAIAVLCMGAKGQMMGVPAGQVSYTIALLFLIFCLCRMVQLIVTGWQSWQNLQGMAAQPTFITTASKDVSIVVIDAALPFAAQIGFWRSRLFVSQGLLDNLTQPHLEAVLLHEQAHAYYQDTFWFFWLGCLRQVMPWLPNTEQLWEELLILRELRADCWATQYTDGLLIAEALVQMVRYPLTNSIFLAAFDGDQGNIVSRIEERIEYLLSSPQPLPQISWRSLLWISCSLLPLTALPLHY